VAPAKRLLYTAIAASAAAGALSGSLPAAAKVFSSAFVFSLASDTLGSSNGLMPSAAPATAVANSQRKNSAPRLLIRVLRRSTGCPAASRAARRA